MLLAIAAEVVVHVSEQNDRLLTRYQELHAQTRLPYRGYLVSPFDAVSVSGDSLTVGAAGFGERQVVFYLSSGCPFCQKSLPGWNRVASELAGDPDVQVVGIGTEPRDTLASFVTREKLRFPVVPFPDPRTKLHWRAHLVPVTTVLDSGGRVLHVRAGPLIEGTAIDSIVRWARFTDHSGGNTLSARAEFRAPISVGRVPIDSPSLTNQKGGQR